MIRRLFLLTLTFVLLAPGVAAALWSETLRVNGGQLVAASVAPPALSCRTRVLGGVTFSWAPVSGATGYTFYPTSTSSGEYLTETSKVVVSLAGEGTATVVAHRDFGRTTWTSKRSNGVQWGSLVLAGC